MAPGEALNRVLGPSRGSLQPTRIAEGDARTMEASDVLTFASRHPVQPHQLQVRFSYLLPNQQDLPDGGFCSGRQKWRQNTDEANHYRVLFFFFQIILLALIQRRTRET